MTGADLKALIASCDVSVAALSKELGISTRAVRDSLEAKRLRDSTVDRYCAVIAQLNRAKAARRERLRIEQALAELPA